MLVILSETKDPASGDNARGQQSDHDSVLLDPISRVGGVLRFAQDDMLRAHFEITNSSFIPGVVVQWTRRASGASTR